MKSAHLIYILLGFFFLSQILGAQVDEKDNKKCCGLAENIEAANCAEDCGESSDSTIQSIEQKEVIEPLNQSFQTTSVFSLVTSACRSGFRRDSFGICRKVLAPRTTTPPSDSTVQQ
jgi:hypothetical protein